MKAIKAVLALLFIYSNLAFAEGNMVVIVNKNNPIEALTRSELIDLFMGRYVAFPDGHPAIPVDLNSRMKEREYFYTRLTGRPISQINAYWARIRFTGRASPPVQVSDKNSVIELVKNSRDAIGYIFVSDPPNDVKIVYVLYPPE